MLEFRNNVGRFSGIKRWLQIWVVQTSDIKVHLQELIITRLKVDSDIQELFNCFEALCELGHCGVVEGVTTLLVNFQNHLLVPISDSVCITIKQIRNFGVEVSHFVLNFAREERCGHEFSMINI